MSAEVSFTNLDDLKAAKIRTDAKETYFHKDHHCAQAYGRIENWYPDVKDYTFETKLLSLSKTQGVAIMKYFDEVKLRCAVRDQERRERGEEVKSHNKSLDNPAYLEELNKWMWDDWPKDNEFKEWHASLVKLEKDIDEILATYGKDGGFIKLSTRSPKDATLNLLTTRQLMKQKVKDCPDLDDMRVLGTCSWETLRVESGKEAMRLLLFSERIHQDISVHEILMQDEGFNLQVAVRRWCNEFDPNWEFRAFVSQDVLTSMTIYNPLFYHPDIVTHKDHILDMCLVAWHRVRDKISATSGCINYAIDFAVVPDLSKLIILEINAMLPPLAGSGLFDWYNPDDKAIILGPHVDLPQDNDDEKDRDDNPTNEIDTDNDDNGNDINDNDDNDDENLSEEDNRIRKQIAERKAREVSADQVDFRVNTEPFDKHNSEIYQSGPDGSQVVVRMPEPCQHFLWELRGIAPPEGQERTQVMLGDQDANHDTQTDGDQNVNDDTQSNGGEDQSQCTIM